MKQEVVYKTMNIDLKSGTNPHECKSWGKEDGYNYIYLLTGHKINSVTFLNIPINDTKINYNTPVWVIVTAQKKKDSKK